MSTCSRIFQYRIFQENICYSFYCVWLKLSTGAGKRVVRCGSFKNKYCPITMLRDSCCSLFLIQVCFLPAAICITIFRNNNKHWGVRLHSRRRTKARTICNWLMLFLAYQPDIWPCPVVPQRGSKGDLFFCSISLSQHHHNLTYSRTFCRSLHQPHHQHHWHCNSARENM